MDQDNFTVFRSKGLGSSDMPVIMGVSPYKTRYTLWLEKSGQKLDDFVGNYSTERGIALEPVARELYNIATGRNMISERIVHPLHPYLRCNADGVDHDAKRIIEIKCGSKDGHYKIPDKYYPQLVFLSYMFGYDIDYVSYWNDEINIIPVPKDEAYTKKLIEEAHKFWELIVTGTPPDLCDADIRVVNDPLVERLLAEYEIVKTSIDNDTVRLKEIQDQIASMIPAKKSICGKYSLTWTDRKGTIDYKNIPSLKDIDVELYRSKPSRFFTIKKKGE